MSEKDLGVSDAPPVVSDDKVQTVTYETYSKLLGQRKADQEETRKLKEQLGIIEQSKDAESEAKLVEDKKWSEAFDLKNKQLEERNKRISELETNVTSLNTEFDTATRLQAVADKLPGKLKKSEYYNFIDTSKIIVDPETNALDETSVAEVANNFIKDYSELLDISKGKMPLADSASSTATLTVEQWKRLPLEERKSKMGAVYKANT